MKSKIILIQILILLLVNSLLSKDVQRVWIYFADKGQIESKNVEEIAKQYLSEKSITRRAQKNISIGYDFTDLPINRNYVNELRKNGIKIIHKSKWLNAVSTLINNEQYKELIEFEFINKIVPVKSFNYTGKGNAENIRFTKQTNLDYGSSFNQNNMIGIPAFHSQNYNGSGVLIALFDTGFKLTHEAFHSVNILNTWDFVENDSDVTGLPGESHGSKVLGIIGGYSPGDLIGPAYGSDYILAKTDHYITETHRDEDNWVAAAEWADSLGADIISSSVGYNLFDAGELDYTYEDMDGKTTLVTKAADLAVKKGIAVFSTAGNEGSTGWRYVLAPADGDSVIAVGAVTADSNVTSYSSRGPTYDGRIKPDLVAQGSAVRTVSTLNDSGFSSATGTSYSTPLAAGAGALVLSYNPSLSPMELYNILVKNASNYFNPDTNIGYGIINIAPIIEKKYPNHKSLIKISSNPFSDYINIRLDYPSEKNLMIYNSLGQKIKTFNKSTINFTWYGNSDNNRNVATGVYFIVMVYNNLTYAKKIILIR
jgi:serine protease AprX